MNTLNVAILGCGWLGLPLLKTLVADRHSVRGSSRRDEQLAAIRKAGGQAFFVDLPEKLPAAFLEDADRLVVSLPPRGRTLGAGATDHYLTCMAALRPWWSQAENCRRTIFLSSTGVYGEARGRVDEDTPHQATTASGEALVAAEQFFATLPARPVVLYLSGLVGPDRHPGRFYGGRDRPVPRADAPVNLVHQQDAIAAIRLLLDRPGAGSFNACNAAHPPKGAFYVAAAAELGLSVAGLIPGGADDKRIDSGRLRALGWQPEWDNLSLTSL